MGFRHGGYCVGCCWFLMALLFVVGVMNLAWIAAVAIYVAFEKLMPHHQWLSRAAGIVLIVAGVEIDDAIIHQRSGIGREVGLDDRVFGARHRGGGAQ